jgi:hypothetical protein
MIIFRQAFIQFRDRRSERLHRGQSEIDNQFRTVGSWKK